MSNLFALMAMIITIGFLCLSVTLLFHGSHCFNSTNKESTPSSVSRRFKRLASVKNSSSTCKVGTPDVLNNSLVLESMKLFLTGDNIENFVDSAIHNRVSSEESLESFNEHSKFAKLIDGYPALSFSINLPEFDCFSSTLLKEIMERIKPLYLEFKNGKSNFIQIEQIPDDILTGVLNVILEVFLLLRNISQKSQPPMPPYEFSKDQCHFTFRCHFLLRHFHGDKSDVSLYFTKLNNATNKLSPKFESFKPEFLSMQAISINFDRFDIEIIGQGPYTYSLYRDIQNTRMSANLHEKSIINNLIKSKISNATSNLAYEIFNVLLSSTHGNFVFFDVDDRKGWRYVGENVNYYEIPNHLQRKKIEFYTFVSQNSEFYELPLKNSTIESQYAGVVISADDDRKTYFKTVDLAYLHLAHYHRHLILTEASAEVAERLSTTDENEMKEFKNENDLYTALFEFGDLFYLFHEELKQKSKSETALTDSILKMYFNDKFRKLTYVIIPSAATLAVIGMLVFYVRRRRIIGARDDLSLRTQIDTLTE